jgi:hypothetical protein
MLSLLPTPVRLQDTGEDASISSSTAVPEHDARVWLETASLFRQLRLDRWVSDEGKEGLPPVVVLSHVRSAGSGLKRHYTGCMISSLA